MFENIKQRLAEDTILENAIVEDEEVITLDEGDMNPMSKEDDDEAIDNGDKLAGTSDVNLNDVDDMLDDIDLELTEKELAEIDKMDLDDADDIADEDEEDDMLEDLLGENLDDIALKSLKTIDEEIDELFDESCGSKKKAMKESDDEDCDDDDKDCDGKKDSDDDDKDDEDDFDPEFSDDEDEDDDTDDIDDIDD